jgi:hypothetical protein
VTVPTKGKNSTQLKVPLLLLVQSSVPEIVDHLIRAGASPASFSGLFNNVYHLCVSFGRNDLLRAILEVESRLFPDRLLKSLDVIAFDSQTSSLFTPFTVAIENGNLEGAKLLVSYGAKLQPDKKVCDAARLRSSNVQKKDWSVRQGLKLLSECTPASFLSPVWRVIRSFVQFLIQTAAVRDRSHKRHRGYSWPSNTDSDDDEDDEYESDDDDDGNRDITFDEDEYIAIQQSVLLAAAGLRNEIAHLSGRKADGKHPRIRSHEKSEKSKASRRLLAKDRFEKVCEILTWLVKERKLDVNEKIAVSNVSSIGIRLFEDEEEKKVPPITPTDFVLSLIAQLQENSAALIKQRTKELTAPPLASPVSGPRAYREEIQSLQRLTSDKSRVSSYEQHVIASALADLQELRDKERKSEAREVFLSRQIEDQKDANKWITETLQSFYSSLKGIGGSGKARAVIKEPQNKRGREDESDTPHSAKAPHTAAASFLFGEYRLLSASSGGSWNAKVPLAPEDIQPLAHDLFKSCFSGDLGKVKEILSSSRVPIGLLDSMGRSPLAVTLLGEGGEGVQTMICRELLAYAEKQFVDLLKAKADKDEKDPNKKKLDNYKLFAKHGGSDSDDNSDDEDEDEDEDEEEEEEDDDADMAEGVGEGKTALSPAKLLLHKQYIRIPVIERYLSLRNRKEWVDFLKLAYESSSLQKSIPKTMGYSMNIAAIAILSGNHSAFRV